ncbi:MAG: aldehyde ferredoxin oxidoreductase C-terminal domain-containing protein [Candidatus Moduliflexus flocculans]|nr:aldehyde ferredoxin oxidoreductase C-terminal domain-containing protein [Candidatus Moduliflexus flocculans]
MGSLNYLCDDYGIDTMSGGCVLELLRRRHRPRRGRRATYRFGDAAASKLLLGAIARREGEIGNILAEGSMRAAHKFGHGSDRLRHAGQGPRGGGLQLQVHPGHGPGLRGQPDRRPPQGILGHHLRAQAVRARILRPREGPEGHRPPADPGRPVRVHRLLPLPLDRDRLGPRELPQVLQARQRARLDPRRLLDDLGPDLLDDQALLAAGIPADRPHGWTIRPAVWFDPANVDTEGPIAGKHLEYDKYDGLLQHYYDLRGYDRRGIPTKATLERPGRRRGGPGGGEVRQRSDMKITVKLIGPFVQAVRLQREGAGGRRRARPPTT